MNAPAPLPTAVEVCTLLDAEQPAFADLVRRLHARADEYQELDVGHDLRRAAGLLDAAQAGIAVFTPHAATGLATIPRAELVVLRACAATVAATGPRLQCAQVNAEQAQARAVVEALHTYTDFFAAADAQLAATLRDAAVLLDDYQAGHAIARPSARSGLALLPATLPPKVRAAVEGLIAALDDDGADDVDAALAISGGQAVLRLLAEVVPAPTLPAVAAPRGGAAALGAARREAGQ